jgi:SAM-dependent methyltransferase
MVKPSTKTDTYFERLFRPMRETLNAIMLEKLKPYVGGYTLNVGCGYHGFGDVRLDIRKTSASNIVGDARILPFKDNVFDTVLALSFLHHIPNYWLAIREILRVLKPKGKVVGWEPNIYHPYLITFTCLFGLSNERPLKPQEVLAYYRRFGGKIFLNDMFFGARCIFNFIRNWKLLNMDKHIPKKFRGYFLYVVEKK